jgi:hypothetical protein
MTRALPSNRVKIFGSQNQIEMRGYRSKLKVLSRRVRPLLNPYSSASMIIDAT